MNFSADKIVQTSPMVFPGAENAPGWVERNPWPASWVTVNGEDRGSRLRVFRLTVNFEADTVMKVHVTADQRYKLYIDNICIGKGSERGHLRKWFYETYRIRLNKGKHIIGALTWFIAQKAPWAQVSSGAGFLMAAESPFIDTVSTGRAAWEGRIIDGASFIDSHRQAGRIIGSGARLDYRDVSMDALFTDDAGWQTVTVLETGNNGFYQGAFPATRVLHPATLPAMRREKKDDNTVVRVLERTGNEKPYNAEDSLDGECGEWQSLLDGGQAEVPSNVRRSVLIDLGDYCCTDYRLETSGGAGSEITVFSAERLARTPDISAAPEDRIGIDGRYFAGTGDRFVIGDNRAAVYESLWWQAGRWVRIEVVTGSEPLSITGLRFRRTGYPLQKEYSFTCNDEALNAVAPAAFNTLRNCVHETFMDCPFWEQLQYLGDTRLQALLTFATGTDTRPARKALDIFRYSMLGSSPFPASNFPARRIQIIPPFSLWWICMVHDYARWAGDGVFIRKLLPLAWWIVDHFLLDRDGAGMVRSPRGWNFVDAAAFDGGEPAGASPGKVSGILNLQLVLALNGIREICGWLNEHEGAARAERLAEELARCSEKCLWDENRGCLADDPEHTAFSEHTQALAILTGRFSGDILEAVTGALCGREKLLKAGSYFSHYICRAFHQQGRGRLLVNRLREWHRFVEAGFTTFPEYDVQSRSDCHAWSAHPLFHFLTSVAGIRPGSFGFKTVLISPAVGDLSEIKAVMPHPDGRISLHISKNKDGYGIKTSLPAGLGGIFEMHGQTVPLSGGPGEFTIQGAVNGS